MRTNEGMESTPRTEGVTGEGDAVNGRRIAIACQGGGSQCAFVAGALKALFARGVQRRFRIVGLSGTSGGAMTAALAWYGLLKQAQGDRTPVEDRVLACWNDLTAQTPLEILFDRLCLQTLRLVERGLLPSVASSPSSFQFKFLQQMVAAMVGRPAFTDLRALLVRHLDLQAARSLIGPESPVLLVGASDVLKGDFRVFSSANGEITTEALLASAAIPSLFPAVAIEDHAYWDGIFSSNPPLAAFLQEAHMGRRRRPEEIWIIQVNRAQHDFVPDRPSDIFDRRNHLGGNLSLQHEVQMIEAVNILLKEGALTDLFRSRFGLDAQQAITIRYLRMSDELQNGLDYPSKLSRQPAHIARLIADGEAQAKAFLASLPEEERPGEVSLAGPWGDGH
jgi:NTE family protein